MKCEVGALGKGKKSNAIKLNSCSMLVVHKILHNIYHYHAHAPKNCRETGSCHLIKIMLN